jgi:hypothetical protein
MKTNIRKAFALFGALLTAGIGIGLINSVPQTAEAALGMN